jgi:sodium/potassium-transporting ATPase subunit alpha
VIEPGRLAVSPPEQRLALLGSTPDGLSDAEAARRRRRYGPNTPLPPQRSRPLATLLGNITHTLALLLWFAAGLAFAAGVPELGAAIIAVVAVNGVFAFIQEYHAEQVISGLMRRVAVQAVTVRAGHERRLPAMDLVPGDIVRLQAGDLVPADCVLLRSDSLSLDLSLLTGETLPVERNAEAITAVSPQTRVFDLSCIAPAGAAVITGSAEAVVFATGPASTLGKVAALVEGVHRGRSILERQIAELSRVTAVIAVLAGAGTLALATLTTSTGFVDALTFATGVIVALVPEGLLPTLSVSLALGAERMAKRGAAVRRLAAVEIVGSVTVICTDKTGTLTENSLAVLGFVAADGGPVIPTAALQAAALCNDARATDGGFTGDPVDVALAGWAAARGHDPTVLHQTYPRLDAVPFDAHRRFMSVTCDVNGTRMQFIKGAPEAVLSLAEATPSPALATALAASAERGERVLLLAAGPADTRPAVLGLVRLYDPPRPEVPAALAACRRAGVRVIMLTGDHPATAEALARMVGMSDGPRVRDGSTLDALSDAELLDLLRSDAIFARIDPGQKLRIVTLLRRAGEVVVVTGDGINDAPALRAADVGVAMGRRGTEVAKQAADIVLADDNFATIVAAIEEGRAIKANIRRFVSYVFTSNVAELAPFLVYIFLPIPLPLAIMQVLAIDLGTDLLPALALGAEPPAAATMCERPEPPQRPLLTPPLMVKTFLFFGLIEAALGLAAYFGFYLTHGWRLFESLAPDAAMTMQAATLTFVGIVAGQVGCVFAQRDGSLRQRLSVRSNRWIGVGVLAELALTVLLVYTPGLNRLFSMAAVPPVWLLMLPAGAAVFILLDTTRRALAHHLHRVLPDSRTRPMA